MITDWKLWWKEVSSRIYELRILRPENGNLERSAVVKNQGAKQREQRTPGGCWQWEANGQCSEGDNCTFRHDIKMRAKSTQPNYSPSSSHAARWEKCIENPKVPEARVPVEGWLDCRSRITSKELAQLYSVKNGILRSACSTRQIKDSNWVYKCSWAHRLVDEQPSKRCRKNGDKSAVAIVKMTRQLGCVFENMESPKSSSILRKSSNILKPIRCVRFTEAVVRHADIRDQKTSFGVICPDDPHQRNPKLQNLRIGIKKRQKGKSDMPVK